MKLVRIAKSVAPIFVSVMGRFTGFGGTVGLFQNDLDGKHIEDWAEAGTFESLLKATLFISKNK